jgi:DNA-binding YbaB/EbfC family protein
MFDQMKALIEMQKKAREMKRELEATTFEVQSSDGLVKLTMNGSQELKAVKIQSDSSLNDHSLLERAIQDAFNRAIKRSHEIAAEKMKEITGVNLPGLF